ncbi:MAG: pantoate--beta-alanine ligase [Bdellovibrionota bacterium]
MSSKQIVCETITQLRTEISKFKANRQTIGFVPTMGYLHQGHLSLIDKAREKADLVVVSIFVNPTQFNNPEDLEKYPRDTPRDLELLQAKGVELVFLPTKELLYQPDFQSWVELSKLTMNFEGAERPGHFKGVTTIVSMLFNLVQPDIAVFGEKDFQQLRVIEQMVEDLKFPLKVLRGETLREEDGLAMSSRNVRLSNENRLKALNIFAALSKAQELYAAGNIQATAIQSIVEEQLANVAGMELEYVAVVNEDLEKLDEVDSTSRVLVAVRLDGIRLIDNCCLAK